MPTATRTGGPQRWARLGRWTRASRDPAAVRYWQQRPLLALWPLLLAIALLFSVLPLIGDITALGRVPAAALVLTHP